MPYQLISFVTPPFAGYVSGHSTFSRAAAEALTQFTGDAYFPGGLYEYPIEEGVGLDFEYGPFDAISLQWATYIDASDEASLSRIYGAIHPQADDFTGRRIGQVVSLAAWEHAQKYFSNVPEPSSASIMLLAGGAILKTAHRGRRRATALARSLSFPSDGAKFASPRTRPNSAGGDTLGIWPRVSASVSQPSTSSLRTAARSVYG